MSKKAVGLVSKTGSAHINSAFPAQLFRNELLIELMVEVATAPQAEEHLEQRHVVTDGLALLVEPVDRVHRAHLVIARATERHEVPRLLRVLAVRPALGIGDDVRGDDIGQQWRQPR